MKTILNVVVTEVVGASNSGGSNWYMNIDAFNDDDDIYVSEELAKAILKDQSNQRNAESLL